MHFKLTKEFLENLIEIINVKDAEKAKSLLNGLHAADIAEIYNNLDIDQAKYLFLLIEDGDKAADVIAELNDDDREHFLKALPSEVIAGKFIDYMDSDDAADVIADLSENKQSEVLKYVKDLDQAGDIVDLLTYDEDTAGGLMAKELVTVNINSTVKNAIAQIREQAEEIDEVFYVYVINNDNILQGTLSLKRLLLTKPENNIADVYNSDVISVKSDLSSEDVVLLSDKYDLVALPVVDTIGRLLGRITFDDLVDVMREEAEKDYQMISGITKDIEPSDKVWMIIRARLPWLLVGLAGGILGAQVIGVYEADLKKHAAMTFFIPLIAAMGGNVGVQSSSIVVQGLANKSLKIESTLRKIFKELSVALINGIVLSSITFFYNLIFSDSFALTLTVSTALFVVIIFASAFGTFVPLALNYFKIDPAVATGPFITTANDIIGLFIYLAIGGILFSIIV